MEVPEIDIFKFKLFQGFSGLSHGVFSRSGGVSQGAFDSLNVGLNSGDDPSAVAENRRRMLAEMGTRQSIFLNQVHGSDIYAHKNQETSAVTSPSSGQDTAIVADGVVTDRPGVCLVIQVADCQAILLFDPEKQVIANVHSGWRGSVHNIIGNCLEMMTRQFGCRPEHILAGISPSLGPCCGEFVNYQEEIPQELWSYKESDRPYFDFWKISRDQLMAQGVKKEHIEIMDICTQCRSDLFYSYRKDNLTGRFAASIALRRPDKAG